MYSKRGAQKGVLEKGYSEQAFSIRVLKKSTQKRMLKRVLKHGITKGVLEKGTHRSGETASGSCGRICGVLAGSARKCAAAERRVCAARHCRVLTRYSRGTHAGSGSDGPVCTAALAWVHGTQCSACVRHDGVYSKVGERHRTEGDLACAARRVLDGYSRAEYRAHRSAPVRQHCGCVLSAYAMHCEFVACAAPTRVPTGTPAPTNAGDTSPPTRAPNFADPAGEGDAIGATCLPSLPASPPFLLPPPPCRSLHCISVGPHPPDG